VGVHDHIDGDVARAHDQGDCTDFWHHSDSTIADQWFRIRIKGIAVPAAPAGLRCAGLGA
jgi:hypothetical protein